MIPGTKKKKGNKRPKETPLAITNEESKPKKIKRRRSSRGFNNVYERLLHHRESRTALKDKAEPQ